MDVTSVRYLSDSIKTRTDLEIVVRRLLAKTCNIRDGKKIYLHRRRFERQQILEVLVNMIKRDLTAAANETRNALELVTNADMTLAVCDFLRSAFNTDKCSLECLMVLIGTISWCLDSVIGCDDCLWRRQWPYKHIVMKLFRLLSVVYEESCQNSGAACFRCGAIRQIQREMITTIAEDCFAYEERLQYAVTDPEIGVYAGRGRVLRRIMTSAGGDYDFCDLLVDLLQSPELPEPILLIDVFGNTFAKEFFELQKCSKNTLTFLSTGPTVLQHWIKQVLMIAQHIRNGFYDDYPADYVSLLGVLLVQLPALLMSSSVVASIVLLALADVVQMKMAASQEFVVHAILDYNILPYVVPFMCHDHSDENNNRVEDLPLETRSALRFVLALNGSAPNDPYLYEHFFEDRHGITSAILTLMPLWTSRFTGGYSKKNDLEIPLLFWIRDIARYAADAVETHPSLDIRIVKRIQEVLSPDTMDTLSTL